MSLLKWMGVGQGSPAAVPVVAAPGEKVPGDANGKMFGMENFGNTCYANSILQALYFCQPFRDLVCITPDGLPAPDVAIASIIEQAAQAQSAPPSAASTPKANPNTPRIGFKHQNSHTNVPPLTPASDAPPVGNAGPNGVPPAPVITVAQLPRLPPTLFAALRSLFLHISLNVEEKGMASPSAFMAKLKKENTDFRTSQHQDAHEFLNYLLNKISEDLADNMTRSETPEPNGLSNGLTPGSSLPSTSSVTPASSAPATPPPFRRPLTPTRPTLVQNLFEGLLTNETRCLNCQTVSARDETFLDLSIDIEPNTSVTACMREFSKGEMLREDNKFKCDHCDMLCDAEKRMKIKVLPNILALHLKRFKYTEDQNKVIRLNKLTYRVAFPLELRLFDTSDDAENPDRLYELFAIVVHIGAGPHHGHYVTVVRTQGKWILFDDDTVETIKETDIWKYFGDAPGGQGYVLFYQAVDVNLYALGLPDPQHPAAPRTWIPPVSFPPVLSSARQFNVDGQVFTPYAGTSNAAQAASLTPNVAPAPAPPPRKGLKLDIPTAPKFDTTATLNSLRSLAGPLTMPSLTPGNAGTTSKENAGFFNRTLRHSVSSKGEKASNGPLTSPITKGDHANGAGGSGAAKSRPGSRGKDAANWLTSRMTKKKDGEETPVNSPVITGDDIPPVPPLPNMHQVTDVGLVGLGIMDNRRPSAFSQLERVPGSLSSTPPPEPTLDTVPLPGIASGFATPVSSPGLPDTVSMPVTPPARPQPDTQERLHRDSIPRSRSLSSQAFMTTASPRGFEETNGHAHHRGRQSSRGRDEQEKGEHREKSASRWFNRKGKEKKRLTSSLERSGEEADEESNVTEFVNGAPSSMLDHAARPTMTMSPEPSMTQTDPFLVYAESESNTSSEDRVNAPPATTPPPISYPSHSHSAPFSPTLRSAPPTPSRNSLDTTPSKADLKPQPRRKLSMTRPLRLSWLGKAKEDDPAKTTPLLAPETPNPAKKSRTPTDALKNLHF